MGLLSKLGKWNSRKLFAAVVAVIAGAAFPGLIPILTLVAPTYIGIQGVVDATEKLGGVVDWYRAAKKAGKDTDE